MQIQELRRVSWQSTDCGRLYPQGRVDWTGYNKGDREHGQAYSLVGKREEYESSRT